jgi:hypothetical protein
MSTPGTPQSLVGCRVVLALVASYTSFTVTPGSS